MNAQIRNKNQITDYIVVGQGLAGSVLAYKLLEQGKSVLIIDETKGETASKKASGLVNPITGRRFVKSWRIDDFLPYALSFYRSLEDKFNIRLVEKTKVHRILQSLEQQNDWAAKTKDVRYANYLKKQELVFHDETQIKNPLGCVAIEPVLKVNAPLLIDTLSLFFEKQNLLLRTKFDYSLLKLANNKITYQNQEAKHIIFCEGSGVKKNPFFKDLPILYTKGEALWFEAEHLTQDFVIGGNTNIIPWGNQNFSVGATYAWDDISLETTKAKKEELLEKLEGIINCNYKIIKQIAGIRPTVKDRRPILGTHKDYKNMHIFNGMGTKGLSLVPYFSQAFIDCLPDLSNLDQEISIQRFIN